MVDVDALETQKVHYISLYVIHCDARLAVNQCSSGTEHVIFAQRLTVKLVPITHTEYFVVTQSQHFSP